MGLKFLLAAEEKRKRDRGRGGQMFRLKALQRSEESTMQRAFICQVLCTKNNMAMSPRVISFCTFGCVPEVKHEEERFQTRQNGKTKRSWGPWLSLRCESWGRQHGLSKGSDINAGDGGAVELGRVQQEGVVAGAHQTGDVLAEDVAQGVSSIKSQDGIGLEKKTMIHFRQFQTQDICFIS